MCRSASLFLLQRLKGSMSGDTRDFNNIETRALINFFSLEGKALKEIQAILTNIRGTCTIVCHRQKLGGPVFDGGDFSTCDVPHRG